MRGLNTSARHLSYAVAGAGATSAPRFLTVSAVGELGIVLALSVLFPFLIHLLPVPDDARLGARLLPMFYAPLLAWASGTLTMALPGIAILVLINWLALRFLPPGTGGGGLVAA